MFLINYPKCHGYFRHLLIVINSNIEKKRSAGYPLELSQLTSCFDWRFFTFLLHRSHTPRSIKFTFSILSLSLSLSLKNNKNQSEPYRAIKLVQQKMDGGDGASSGGSRFKLYDQLELQEFQDKYVIKSIESPNQGFSIGRRDGNVEPLTGKNIFRLILIFPIPFF